MATGTTIAIAAAAAAAAASLLYDASVHASSQCCSGRVHSAANRVGFRRLMAHRRSAREPRGEAAAWGSHLGPHRRPDPHAADGLASEATAAQLAPRCPSPLHLLRLAVLATSRLKRSCTCCAHGDLGWTEQRAPLATEGACSLQICRGRCHVQRVALKETAKGSTAAEVSSGKRARRGTGGGR